MTGWKKAATCLLAVAICMASSGIISFAADKKITSVTLDISADITVGDEMGTGEIEITSSSKYYTVGEFEFTNSGFSWSEDDTPEMELYLYAEDGYYFSVTGDKIKLKGDEARYVKMRREDSSRTLVLTLTLTPLSQIVGSIETAQLSSDGWAVWSATPGAGSYEVFLYRDGKSVGASRITTDTSYFFGTAMGKTGSYTAKIRGLGKEDISKKSNWISTVSCYVSQERADALKQSESTGQQILGQWKQDHNGWWYVNVDGSIPANTWKLIGDKWYYFYDSGYMATGWIPWQGKWYYCNSSGEMLTATTTPDGFLVGADGARVEE